MAWSFRSRSAWRRWAKPPACSLAAAFVRDLSPTDRGQTAFKQARYQEVVRRFSQEAFTEMDLERVVQRAPEILVAALECDASELLMLSKDRREFRRRAAFGAPAPDTPVSADDTAALAGWVASSGEPLVVEDIEAEPRWRAEHRARLRLSQRDGGAGAGARPDRRRVHRVQPAGHGASRTRT